jgi:hypothetical protein
MCIYQKHYDNKPKINAEISFTRPSDNHMIVMGDSLVKKQIPAKKLNSLPDSLRENLMGLSEFESESLAPKAKRMDQATLQALAYTVKQHFVFKNIYTLKTPQRKNPFTLNYKIFMTDIYSKLLKNVFSFKIIIHLYEE